MLNRILSMLAGSWLIKDRFYSEYDVKGYGHWLDPVSRYFTLKEIERTKNKLRRTYMPEAVDLLILSCISYIAIAQWLIKEDYIDSLLEKDDEFLSQPLLDGADDPWHEYLASFILSKIGELRQDVFRQVPYFYVSKSKRRNLNLFAEIVGNDDFSLIEDLIDRVVLDVRISRIKAFSDILMGKSWG